MKKNHILKGLLLAISLGVGCQAIAQTNNTGSSKMSALQQINPDDPGDPGDPAPTPTPTPTPPPLQQPNNPNTPLPPHCGNGIKGSSDSTCITISSQNTIQAPTKVFQASAITPFNNSGTSCTTPWGQVVSDNGEVTAFQSATGTYNYVTGEYAADCVEEQRHCTNGSLSGSYTYQNCSLAPVNGGCGSANGAYYTYPTTGPSPNAQCNPEFTYGGNPPADDSPPSTPASSGAYLNTTNNIYSWTCAGEAGGSSASCSAYRRINGQCGTATNSCNLGNSASPTSTNNYYPNYACSCTTNASGVTTCSANASGNQICTGGYKDTTYNWSCTGINTGTTASCTGNSYVASNDIQPAPPCGGSNQTQTAACGTGYSGNQTRTNYIDNCNNGNVITYGTWNRSSCVCVPTYTSGSQTAACPSGYTGNQTRTTSTNSCTGAVTYGSWNTSSCTAVCNPTYTSGTQTAACPSGYTGNQTRSTSTNSCTGAVTYGSWNTSSCTAVCNPTYTSGTEYAACPSGYTGNQSRTTSTNSCTGAVTYGSWNTSSCTATCTPTYTSGTQSAACPSGYTGTQTRSTSTNSCTGAVTYGSWNTSSCTAVPSQGTFSLISRTSCSTGYKNAGFIISATIRNSGSGTITGITHGCAGAYAPSGGSSSLAPGQSSTYTCTLTWTGAYGCSIGFSGTNASNSGAQF